MKFEEPALPKDWEGGKDPNDSSASTIGGAEADGDTDEASSAALGALLDDAGAAADDDPEQRVARLGGQLARLDALNVAGMLAAATEGGGARLASRLEAGLQRAAALSARLRRADAHARAAPGAAPARSGAAQADANARALLRELDEIYAWLDPPPLRDLDALPEIPLTTAEGRARALAACDALRAALRAEAEMPAARRRLGAVRERLRRLTRARDQVAAAVARHVNNLLIHLGNEAAAAPPAPAAPAAPLAPRHHAELLPLAPLMRCLKDMDEKSFDALAKVYCGTWSRAYERMVRVACEGAGAGGGAGAAGGAGRAEEQLDAVLALVESLCNAEQDFCTHFFCLDQDVKSDGSDGERSEKSEGGRGLKGGGGGAGGGAESRRYMQALFPALEPALMSLTQTVEKHDQYGAFVVLACVGRRVLGAESPGAGAGAGAGAGETRWARAALAGAAVSAKRQADRCVAERVAALEEAARAAARRPKCGVLPFLKDFEDLSANCERIFAGGRRADLERWYGSLARAMLECIAEATHPRTPRSVLLLENYHALGGALAALRVPALEAARREARARYAAALKAYVTHYFGRPLEKLTLFFEGVSEAVAMGVREEEVCYRAAFSKHELRRVLALYPAHEVRKSLHRLYRTVEKHLSEESGLLQVVWRAMQEEFIAQHRALQSRIQACYPAAGLALPLTTQHILDAFSDIAREH